MNASTASASDTVITQRFHSEVIPLSAALYWNARRLTGRHSDAQDLLQETLMHAYTGFTSFEPGTNINAWLMRIMRNQWINSYRRSQRRPAERFECDWSDRMLGTRAEVASVDQRSAEERVLAGIPDDSDVARAFRALPTHFRVVLYHADVEGYSYQEIATLMNIPLGTVMSRLHRGRRRMRAHLTDCRDRT